jgi:hypothetical protein
LGCDLNILIDSVNLVRDWLDKEYLRRKEEAWSVCMRWIEDRVHPEMNLMLL